MKKMKFYPVALAAIMMLNVSCVKECIESGKIASETRSVSGVTGINAEDAFKVYVTKGDTELVRIETDGSNLSRVKTTVSGNILNIYIDPAFCRCSFHHLNAYVTVKSLNSIEASGASEVSADSSFNAENFDVIISGASKVDLALSVTNILNFNASGASEANLSGSATTLLATGLSGASKLHAYDLFTERTVIENSGASTAELSVAHELDVTASGASVVKYKGNPYITYREVSGASSVVKQ